MVDQEPGEGVAVAFDSFGWSELSAEARTAGCSEADLVARAIGEYVEQVERASWSMSAQVPGFLRDAASQQRLIEVDLDPDQLASLRAEADRQGVTVAQLVIHAVLLKLARA